MAKHQMTVYGHRGAAGEAPENTIAGCRHAIGRGVRQLEIDLRLSAEDELVILHDKTVSRTTNSRGKVSSFTNKQLAKLDARADGPLWPNKVDTGIPTLDALLTATPEVTHYQLEVKPDSVKMMRTIATLLAEKFPDEEAAERVVITSSNSDFHKILRSTAPYLQRGMVASRPNTFKAAVELECHYYCMHWANCNPYFIRQIKKSGMIISVWTVNETQLIKNLHKMNIPSIITDYPSMALPLISSIERD
ncbi:MAG: glycerophosphodiester phosphodiesterase family protein [Pseudomonadales bacterium]